MLIFVHELGHYIAARSFNVSIKEFAIGMGPKLISRRSEKTGIVYSLRLLPIGGFVSMVGEDEASDDEGALINKPVWQRMIITAAGAAMNLVLGIILMAVMVMASDKLGSTEIVKFESEDASSYQSGLEVGDRVVKINDRSTHISYELLYEIMHQGSEPIDVTVIRDGERVLVEDVEFEKITEEGIVFGEIDFYVRAEEKSFANVIKHGFYQSTASIKLVWDSLIDFISGKYGVDQVSGPVGVTTAIGNAAKQSTVSLLYLCGIITINLGMFNLIPIPALDGGRLLFQLIELIRRKPVKPEIEGYIHFIGIVILMLFMVFVSFKDIIKLFAK